MVPLLRSYCLSSQSPQSMSAHNVLHLYKCTHGHVGTWTVALCRKSRVGCKWFDWHQKCIGNVSVHLQLEMNTPEFLNVPTHCDLNSWGQTNMGAVPLKLGHIFIWTSFLILLQRTHFWNVSKHFEYTWYPGITLITIQLLFQTSAGKSI